MIAHGAQYIDNNPLTSPVLASVSALKAYHFIMPRMDRPNPSHEIEANEIYPAFKKICENDFSRNIEEGFVCVIAGDAPEDYKERADELCYAHYHGNIDWLEIRKGKEAGKVVRTNTGW